jgi:hypothetical protein
MNTHNVKNQRPAVSYYQSLPTRTHYKENTAVRSHSIKQYNEAMKARNSIISENKSRRMRSNGAREQLPVPPKPQRPLIPVAYDLDGNYGGTLASADDCPENYVVRWEEMI